MKLFSMLFITLFSMLFGQSVFALPPDFTTLTAAVDFSTVITAVLGIFAALASVYIVVAGGRMILTRLRAG